MRAPPKRSWRLVPVFTVLFAGCVYDWDLSAATDASNGGATVGDGGWTFDADEGGGNGDGDGEGREPCAICGAHSQCELRSGVAVCTCDPGYLQEGNQCTADVACSALQCDAHAACVDDGGTRRCECLPGYQGDGQTCADVDECSTENGGCPVTATCGNTDGSRTCACNAGFQDTSGDGTMCADKCTLAGCDPNTTCTIVGVDAVCTCTTPYVGDGKSCTFDQSCSLLACHANATCEVTGASARQCKCRSGFTGSGTECTNVDECQQSPNPCGANSTCQDTDGAFTCGCINGYRNTGSGCQNIDDCATNPCQNGGVCADGVGSFTCDCARTGFSGSQCQTSVNDCSPNPCLNNGSCTDGVNSASCRCPAGFSGGRCETNINECAPNPCQNGGSCTDGVNAFTCNCATGFAGMRCETNSNDCSPNPCQHGGTCTDGLGTYSCKCATGYSGQQCQTNINECAPNPCLNGGTCTDGVGAYSCSCPTGFSGSRCETATNWCAQQAKPAGVADSDYRCADFEGGLPGSAQWTQRRIGLGSLVLSSTRAKSAPNAMQCFVPDNPNADQQHAELAWSVTGGSSIRNARISFDLNPTDVQGLREWNGYLDLACLQNATGTFCLSYVRGTDLNGYFLRVAYNQGLPVFVDCRISASIPGNVWTRVELAVSSTAGPTVKINGSAVSTPDCNDFPLSADSNLTLTAGLGIDLFSYDAFTAYYDNIQAYVQR